MPTPTATATLVVNPSAGRGRAGRLAPRVVEQIRSAHPELRLRVQNSSNYAHARELTRAAVAEGSEALLVMGGDGMAHLGLNACAGTEVRLGVLPAGTGNDFCRGVGLPRAVGPATRAAIAGRTRTIDLARVTGTGETSSGRPAVDAWVGSVVSTGYDARVNRRTNEANLRLGPLAYAGVALAELATYRPLDYRLVVDGEPRDLSAMFIAVANAGWFGGGMNVCPTAEVDDGLLDITIAHPMSRSTLLRLLPTIYFGRHLGHPAVETLRARRVRIDGGDMFAMGDGELLGDVPVEVGCVPGAVQVFVA